MAGKDIIAQHHGTRIVADKISALIKCIEERKAGNTEFKEAEAATRKRIEECNIPEAKVFMEEFLPAYEMTLDELR